MKDDKSRIKFNVSKITGEFNSKKIEEEYFEYEVNSAIKYIRLLVLVMGILYFLFIIPDYFVAKHSIFFKYILVNRISFLFITFILYYRLKNFNSSKEYYFLITMSELIVSFLFLIILYLYEPVNFLIQSFGVMTILLVIFFVPNRFIYIVFVSLFICTSFIIISIYIIEDINVMELIASIIYFTITIILSSFSSLRTSFYRRKQYANNKELLIVSMTDSLTGAYNRMKFEQEMRDLIKKRKTVDFDLSIILFDFDDFKRINDVYGHLIGDKILIDTSVLIKSIIRGTDIFIRWGGEEFVIILPNTKKEQAIDICARIKNEIEKHDFSPADKVTCSFGVTSLKEDDIMDTLFKRVDELLYTAKKNGKNQIVSC